MLSGNQHKYVCNPRGTWYSICKFMESILITDVEGFSVCGNAELLNETYSYYQTNHSY